MDITATTTNYYYLFEEEGQNDSVDNDDIEDDKDICYVDSIDETVMISVFDAAVKQTKM